MPLRQVREIFRLVLEDLCNLRVILTALSFLYSSFSSFWLASAIKLYSVSSWSSSIETSSKQKARWLRLGKFLNSVFKRRRLFNFGLQNPPLRRKTKSVKMLYTIPFELMSPWSHLCHSISSKSMSSSGMVSYISAVKSGGWNVAKNNNRSPLVFLDEPMN